MKYDYEKAVRDDVRRAILDKDYADEIARIDNMDDLISKLENLMWIDDYVTGNGSGSYTTSQERSRANLVGNEDLIVESIRKFGSGIESYENAILDPDFADVTIRCHLLYGAIVDVLDEPEIKKYVKGIIGTKKVQSMNRRPSGNAPRTKKATKTKSTSSKKKKPIEGQRTTKRTVRR